MPARWSFFSFFLCNPKRLTRPKYAPEAKEASTLNGSARGALLTPRQFKLKFIIILIIPGGLAQQTPNQPADMAQSSNLRQCSHSGFNNLNQD